jgi:hypothetical protein
MRMESAFAHADLEMVLGFADVFFLCHRYARHLPPSPHAHSRMSCSSIRPGVT